MSELQGLAESLLAFAKLAREFLEFPGSGLPKESEGKIREMGAEVHTAQSLTIAAIQSYSALLESKRECEAEVAKLKNWDAGKEETTNFRTSEKQRLSMSTSHPWRTPNPSIIGFVQPATRMRTNPSSSLRIREGQRDRPRYGSARNAEQKYTHDEG